LSKYPKPPIIIEDYGLWENEGISFSNIIDDDGLYNNEGICMQDMNESICKIIGVEFI
jgi:hypothetical protein